MQWVGFQTTNQNAKTRLVEQELAKLTDNGHPVVAQSFSTCKSHFQFTNRHRRCYREEHNPLQISRALLSPLFSKLLHASPEIISRQSDYCYYHPSAFVVGHHLASRLRTRPPTAYTKYFGCLGFVWRSPRHSPPPHPLWLSASPPPTLTHSHHGICIVVLPWHICVTVTSCRVSILDNISLRPKKGYHP